MLATNPRLRSDPASMEMRHPSRVRDADAYTHTISQLYAYTAACGARIYLLLNRAYCTRLGVSSFHWFLFAGNLSLNFFGTDCPQVFNSLSCPNVRNTHGSAENERAIAIERSSSIMAVGASVVP
eukprot:COSAG02_NODE_480_length_21469_cov_13.479551_13_plen_125_part_00